MTTINDIPPEILLKIAAAGGNRWDYKSNQRRANAGSKAREFLRNFSLVCRKWQGPGQIRLWEEVHFDGRGKKDAPTLFASSQGTMRGLKTRELSIRRRTSKEVGLIVASSHGVQELFLMGIANLDAVLLEDAALSDLKEFNSIYVLFNEPQIPLQPQFQLTHLRIHFDEFFPIQILSSLLQPSVKCATYSFILSKESIYGSYSYKNSGDILAALASHAPNLQNLAIVYDEARSDLNHLFTNGVCVTDLFLKLDERVERFLGGDPAKFTLFDFLLEKKGTESEGIELRGGLASMRSLEKVVLDLPRTFNTPDMNAKHQEFFDSIRKDLELACQKRKIKFEVQTKPFRVGSFWERDFNWAG